MTDSDTSGVGVLTRGQRLGLLAIAVAVLVGWGVWAFAVLLAERSSAERVYVQASSPVPGQNRAWPFPVTIRSAHARLVGISSFLPPGFDFDVAIEATVASQFRRATGHVSFGGSGANVRFPPLDK